MKNTSVLIVNQALAEEPGKLVNAAFVIGLTSGRLAPEETFGPDVVDGDGKPHTFLTNIAHFVRKASPSKLRALRQEFSEIAEVTVVDYTDAAAPSCYEAYAEALANQSGDNVSYRACHIFGPESIVVPRTKNLSRL